MPEMLEAELKAAVIKIAKREGWLVHHNTNSWSARSSQKGTGTPDLIMARAGLVRGRLILSELKGKNGKLEPMQEEWRRTLLACPGIEYYLWREDDLPLIAKILAVDIDPFTSGVK